MTDCRPMLLASQRGIGTVELLLCAPVLLALIYFIFEINSVIAIFGNFRVAGRNNILSLSEEIEANRLHKPIDKQDAHIKAWFERESEVSQQSLIDRALKTDGTANIVDRRRAAIQTLSEYESTLSRIVNEVSRPLREFLELGYGIKLNGRASLRSSEINLNYQNAPFIQAIDFLTQAPGKGDNLNASLSAMQSHYIESLDGYHLQNEVRPALLGVAIGLLFKTRWMGMSDYSVSSTYFQSRCMSRLTMEDTCEFGSPKGERVFLTKLRRIADVRQAISAELVGSSIVSFGATAAIEEGLVQMVSSILSSIGEDVVNDVVNSLVEKIQQQATIGIPRTQILNPDILKRVLQVETEKTHRIINDLAIQVKEDGK